jgi:hypothetical protein
MFIDNGMQPESPNLTNPKRVKKLTKFFGEDPPLMRLFLKKLGYEVSRMFVLALGQFLNLLNFRNTPTSSKPNVWE